MVDIRYSATDQPGHLLIFEIDYYCFPTFHHCQLHIHFLLCFLFLSGTKVAVELEKVILSKLLCKDIAQLSGMFQTSAVEAFHSLLIHFCPKMFGFSYRGMKCR